MSIEWAREKSAQAWCLESTKDIVMDVRLANAFAGILDTETSRLTAEVATLKVQLEAEKAAREKAEAAFARARRWMQEHYDFAIGKIGRTQNFPFNRERKEILAGDCGQSLLDELATLRKELEDSRNGKKEG